MIARIGRFGNEVVDAVAELVEERDELVVLEKRWDGFGRFAEVADKCSGRVVAGTILVHETGLDVKVRSMTVLAFSWMQVLGQDVSKLGNKRSAQGGMHEPYTATQQSCFPRLHHSRR